MDAVDPSNDDDIVALERRAADARRCRSCASPASAGEGVPELLEAMWQGLAASRQPVASPHE